MEGRRKEGRKEGRKGKEEGREGKERGRVNNLTKYDFSLNTQTVEYMGVEWEISRNFNAKLLAALYQRTNFSIKANLLLQHKVLKFVVNSCTLKNADQDLGRKSLNQFLPASYPVIEVFPNKLSQAFKSSQKRFVINVISQRQFK